MKEKWRWRETNVETFAVSYKNTILMRPLHIMLQMFHCFLSVVGILSLSRSEKTYTNRFYK